MRIDKDYTGTKLGVLTVIGPSHREHGYVVWNARCECGQVRKIGSNNMRATGRFKRCTCAKYLKVKAVWSGDRRNCRECNKRLPKDRYFRHELCIKKEVPYGEHEYGGFCQFGSGF